MFAAGLIFDFLRGAITIGLVLIGIQAIGVALAVALDTDDWFFLALGMILPLGVGYGVLWLTLLVSQFTLTPMVAGWLGMFSGRRPFMYGQDDGLIGRIAGNFLLIGVFAWWGHGIWERAELVGNAFKSVAGLLVMAGGMSIGLLAIVPLVYFALNPGKAEAEDGKDKKKKADRSKDHVPIYEQAGPIVMMLTVAMMIGMSLSRCTAEVTEAGRDSQGRILAPYGDFIFACVDSGPKSRPGCEDPVRFAILPRSSDARRIRIDAWMRCPDVHVKDGQGQQIEYSQEKKRRLGLPLKEPGSGSDRYLYFDSQPDQTYTVEFSSGKKSDCMAGMTYVVDPVWRQQQVSQ